MPERRGRSPVKLHLGKLCVALGVLLAIGIAAIVMLERNEREQEAQIQAVETTVQTEAATIPTTVETVAETTEETVPETTEKVTIDEIPLYFQTDYPDEIYGSGSVATNGCSITSLAMVATYLTDHVYYPDELADYFGGRAENNIERLTIASDMLQLPYEGVLNFHESVAALKEGKVVIALMNHKSIFTNTQHFIVLRGITEDDKILVHDSYEPNYEVWQLARAFENGFSYGDISCGFSGGWAYDKSAMPEEPFIYVEEKPYVECRYPGLHLTYEDKMLLAAMVWVEARGESFDGQQAVAEVVLNRVKSGNFPDTVRGVIYAQDQFRSTKHLKDAEPYQTQFEAVEQALEGPYVLPEDVVFFATYPVNENVWGTIGGHTFCREFQNPGEPDATEETEATEATQPGETLSDTIVVELTEKEQELLMKLAMAEVGNDYCVDCMSLVMCTVLNRRAGGFGDSIESVIYAPDQFTPVAEGTFEDTKPNALCQIALDQVMRGWDESQGALYYEFGETDGKDWHSQNLELLFQHCRTRFYK